MVFKKQVYWAIYLFLLSLITLLIVIRLMLPANYFVYSPVTIVALLVMIGGVLFYQFLRFKHRLIVTENEIKVEGVFSNKNIKKSSIEGFETYYAKSTITVIGHYLIKQKKPSNKSIKIYPNYKNQLELTDWIKQNLTDLNKVNNEEERSEELENDVLIVENLEKDPLKRAVKIQSANRIRLVLNTISILLSVLFFFPHWCFDSLLLLIILLPLIGLVSMFLLKGFLRLNLLVKSFRNAFNRKKKYDDDGNSKHFSDISLTFVIPSLLILYLAIYNHNIIEWKAVWEKAFILLFFIVLVLSIQLTLKRLKLISLVFLMPFLMTYCYGTIVAVNCIFDSSNTTISKLRVVDKNTYQYSKQSLFKRRYKYRLFLTNWLNEDGRYKRVEVTQEHYETTEIGDSVEISFKKGYLDLPWYKVVED